MGLKEQAFERLERSGDGEYPVIDITWKPHMDENYQVEYMNVTIGLSAPGTGAGESLVRLWDNIVSIPASVFTSEGIRAWDAVGQLELTQDVAADYMGFPERHWRPVRDVVGNVVLTYDFYPRVVPHDYRFRPYYDFRNEMFGATGSGVVSLVAPKEGRYHIYVNWDLSETPNDTRAVSVRAEGNHDFIGTTDDYRFTMYAVGKVKSLSSEDGKANIYWLSEPLPDKERVTVNTVKVINALEEFFQDSETRYSVFIRKDPFKYSNGATAFTNGFIYGYSDEMPLNWERAQDIFAHEIIHTWPKLVDRSGLEGESTWYHEGTAEWYNIKILHELGLTDESYVAKQITWRGIEYYANEFNRMPNTEAFKIAWTERCAQWLPYGRGFFYLAEIDRQLKEKTSGAKCIDDLVLELLEESRVNGEQTVVDWEKLIERELGKEAVEYFHDVSNGAYIEPDERWFDGRFTFHTGEAYEPVRGTRAESYVWEVRSDVKAEN